jgi:hypothetical protein
MKNLKQTVELLFILMFGFALFIACTNDTKQQKTKEVQMPETSETTTTTTIPLPDMELTIEEFGENGMMGNQPLFSSDLKKYQIKKMDEYFQDSDSNAFDNSDINYSLLKEMYTGKEGRILLISRTSEMEAIAWLATYDMQSNLVDFKRVYYDEWAESAMHITSVIKSNTITVSEYEMDLGTGKETTKTKVFQIGSDLKFKEVQP